MRQILKCLREYKKDFVITPILVILEAVCELVLIMTIGQFIDELADATSMAVIYQ